MLAVARKECFQIARDLRPIPLVTVAPAFLLGTLFYVFAFDVGRVALVVRDLDKTAFSRDLLSQTTADGDFIVAARPTAGEEVGRLLTYGIADIALAIPPGFGSMALRGHTAESQSDVDGVDAIGVSTFLALLESRVNAFVARTAQRGTGGRPGSLGLDIDPDAVDGLAIKERTWYNAGLQSLIRMVPGLMGSEGRRAVGHLARRGCDGDQWRVRDRSRGAEPSSAPGLDGARIKETRS